MDYMTGLGNITFKDERISITINHTGEEKK